MLRQFDIPSFSRATPEESRQRDELVYSYFVPDPDEEIRNRDNAKLFIRKYILEYKRFASDVLKQIAEELPAQLDTFLLVCQSSLRELNDLESSLIVRTKEEADKVENTVEGLLFYLHAARYLEDRADMLGHAMAQLKSTLRLLNVIRSNQDYSAWQQVLSGAIEKRPISPQRGIVRYSSAQPQQSESSEEEVTDLRGLRIA